MAKRYIDRDLSARYPTDLKAWQALKTHYRDSMRGAELKALFARDKERANGYSLQSNDLLLDYSKNHVSATTRKLLIRLAKEAAVPAAIEAMFGGETINQTEGRSVLHVALRSKISDTVALETPGVREIWEVLSSMEEFVDAVHTGAIVGSTG